MLRFLRLGVFVIFAIPSTARATTIDFESFSDSDVLTNQIAGVTFSNATALTAGVSLNEIDFPPHSGDNVVVDDGGAMSITFASPLASFGGYFTYMAPITLEAFSPAHVSLGSISSAFSANFASSGNSPNEFLQLVFASGLGSVTITGDVGGGSFVLDDAILTPLQGGPEPDPNAPVPEPGTFTLIATAAAYVLRRHRSR